MAWSENVTLRKQQKTLVGRKMKVGDLAQLAGILDWPVDTLLGAFLELAAEKDPHKRWGHLGKEAMETQHNICWIYLDEKLPLPTIRKLRPLQFYLDPFKNALFGPVGHKEKVEKLLQKQ